MQRRCGKGSFKLFVPTAVRSCWQMFSEILFQIVGAVKQKECFPVMILHLGISQSYFSDDFIDLVIRLSQIWDARYCESYVTDRTFVVHVGLSTSSCASTSMGVPQRSVLDPISPFGHLMEFYERDFHKYADETFMQHSWNHDIDLDLFEVCTTTHQHWFINYNLLYFN